MVIAANMQKLYVAEGWNKWNFESRKQFVTLVFQFSFQVFCFEDAIIKKSQDYALHSRCDGWLL